MTTKEGLEDWYKTPDPWEYRITPDDQTRRQHIIYALLSLGGSFSRALDLGAGEGWITEALPAAVKHAYELSDIAASRLPPGVDRVLSPKDKYGLVVATGVLYEHYDWELFTDLIKTHASKIVLTCSIEAWESRSAIQQIPGQQIFQMIFPYRQYWQKLRVFDVSSASDRSKNIF